MKFSDQQTNSTNKTGHLHISFYPSKNDYVVAISRKQDHFYMRTSTLEEALKIRNQVYSFYERRGRFPSREELGVSKRKPRLKNRLEPRTEDAICSECGNEYQFRNTRRYKEFVESGKVCGFCERKKDQISSISIENATGQLNEKYISIDRSYGRKIKYRVCVTKDHEYVVKNYRTLEEAVKARNEIVEFYEKHKRLPNIEEQNELFGIKSRRRENKNNLDEESKVSNTNLKNITFDEASNRYFIQISRDRRKFSTTCTSLDRAIEIRTSVIEFYKDHGYLPTKAELKSFVKEKKND